MIRLKIMYQGTTLLLTSWRHTPRNGELIRINGELYLITEIIHDVDMMQSNRVYDILVEVERR